ncbi:MAG: ABC transporter ATP-binding protein [Deltaproteobacteria bacterium]|nr:ABC transporter ATP-binding protein [Deltaproteobacteria bacterium]MCB9786301.1 ABC transporter ATP-binding protein [Deltaproteobacteria bacterium]
MASLAQSLSVFAYTTRALALVWSTSRRLTVALASLTVVAGLLPAAIAWVGKLIVDGVVAASRSGTDADLHAALAAIALEAGLVVVLAAAQRGLSVCQSLLRALLGHRVNVIILEKALTLSLEQFEDSEFYDRLTRARREASSRPLSLVNRTFALAQNGLSLISYGGLLLGFSGWIVLALALAALPAFIVEARYSGEAFRLFSWRAPETREQAYLETLVAREDYAKEVKLFDLGPLFLGRYRSIFDKLYGEDKSLTLRRGIWGFALGLVSTAAFYGAYGWIAWAAVAGTITLGGMTMYVMVFKQGQSAFAAMLSSIGGMYEDNLYLSNLYSFLEQPTPASAGRATAGPDPADGLRFEDVTFTYPGADRPAVTNVSFHLPPGGKLALVGENGSGKTTLIKLLTRLYQPDSGRVVLDGLDLREWDAGALLGRIGVIFQDFVRYQLTVGENIGVGEVGALAERGRWEDAADKGLARPVIDALPEGFDTQLGRWFKNGRELSMGQWQKIALSRAFMREGADILILDEPTAAVDAAAEAQIFERFRALTADQMAILISHRFSTVRMADQIIVMEGGRIVEQGTHESLMALDARYARLFSLQAQGYR